ncbi:Phosphatidylinositol:ceramide phosphoinositol transferase (IPC synthase) [Metarhizium acridum]|nr:Phosphatidylinositol:ceramide phosphoinositol transferase (IPC synthase) [Metarhizium acridum]
MSGGSGGRPCTSCHHYAIDLVGGGLIAVGFFYSVRARYLPQRQADKITRWEYEFVEIGDRHRLADEEYGHEYFGLGLLEQRRENSSDGWTLGSSSSKRHAESNYL